MSSETKVEAKQTQGATKQIENALRNLDASDPDVVAEALAVLTSATFTPELRTFALSIDTVATIGSRLRDRDSSAECDASLLTVLGGIVGGIPGPSDDQLRPAAEILYNSSFIMHKNLARPALTALAEVAEGGADADKRAQLLIGIGVQRRAVELVLCSMSIKLAAFRVVSALTRCSTTLPSLVRAKLIPVCLILLRSPTDALRHMALRLLGDVAAHSPDMVLRLRQSGVFARMRETLQRFRPDDSGGTGTGTTTGAELGLGLPEAKLALWVLQGAAHNSDGDLLSDIASKVQYALYRLLFDLNGLSHSDVVGADGKMQLQQRQQHGDAAVAAERAHATAQALDALLPLASNLAPDIRDALPRLLERFVKDADSAVAGPAAALLQRVQRTATSDADGDPPSTASERKIQTTDAAATESKH